MTFCTTICYQKYQNCAGNAVYSAAHSAIMTMNQEGGLKIITCTVLYLAHNAHVFRVYIEHYSHHSTDCFICC